jgi:tetratricopeptide (TPR) repeat protein
MDLDSEVQAIKSETLEISLQLPRDESSVKVDNLESLLTRDPAEVPSLDYLRAIGFLEREMARVPIDDEGRLLLARLKLAYGLHLEAGLDLHTVDSEGVPGHEQDRAWYELAEVFYRKGYHEAALEALTRIQADTPPEISGQYQLLHGNVLMSLGKNAEATQVLSPWRAGESLEAYGHYNLAIAFVRVGEEAKAVSALKDAIKIRVEGVETANLRDRARLSLGYLLARQGDYRRARRHLEAVSESGPFANRAMIALGWIAHQQGRPDKALESWAALRAGASADLDVLETLILVPAVYRETEDLETASLEYESAMTAYQRELDELDSVRHRLSRNDTIIRLLDESESQVDRQMKALLGPLLASRQLGAIRRDRSDLGALLDALEQELQDVEAVAGTSLSTVATLPRVEINRRQRGAQADIGSGAGPGEEKSPGYLRRTEAEPTGNTADPLSSPGYELPEIESPPQRQVRPFPDSGSTGRTVTRFPALPQSVQWIKQPPDPEIIGMPDSEIIWLPSSGEFFRRPGDDELEDYAYPDELPGGMSQGDSHSPLPGPEAPSSFDSGARPVGDALKELALALNEDGRGQPVMVESFDPLAQGTERERQIAALRQRILVLRERIKLVSSQYENHARALALSELDRRQLLLENLQEQASLELAKTYDRRSQQ